MIGEVLFPGYKVSVWDDEELVEMESGDGCTIMSVLKNLQTVHLKIIQMINFMLCIFYHNTIKRD